MKKPLYLLLLLPFLFLSCKSKRNLASSLPRLVINVDTLPDGPTAQLFVPDHSLPATRGVLPPGVAEGTQITNGEVKLPAAYSGIERVVNYEFTHRDVPASFEGFRIAFISDLHYKSLFREKALGHLVQLLNDQHPDVLLMGGDYQEGCNYVPELFSALAKVKTPMGTYGVMGNNDYERCHDEIVREMELQGMHVLEQKVDTLRRGGSQIIIAGVRNPFDLQANGQSPTLALSPEDFVLLLVHTPDYVEDVSIAHTDLALAGHTHGGQVRILGFAPIIPSHYGARFLTGLKYNSAQIPMIVTNGIGTSNKNIRIGAPAEVVIITLHQLR